MASKQKASLKTRSGNVPVTHICRCIYITENKIIFKMCNLGQKQINLIRKKKDYKEITESFTYTV